MSKKLKIAAGVSGAAAASYFLTGNVFYGLFLTRQGTKIVTTLMPDHDEESSKIFRENPIIKEGLDWYNSSEKSRVETHTREGKLCHGILIKTPEESHKYVICCHGYTSKPSDMGSYGKEFAKRGFNVLFPVLNGHEDSETPLISMGWLDRLIVVAFANYIADSDPQAQIVLHGCSMGGATVMMATGEKMPANVKCCVEDCGYTSVWDEYSVQIKDYLHMSKFPMVTAADLVAKIYGGHGFKEASAINQLRKSVTPTLFIHGERDTFVPFWMLETNYNAAVCEKDKLAVPDATHSVSAFVHPEIYWEKIDSFVSKYVTD